MLENFAGPAVNEYTDGGLGNYLDNTIGSDPGDMLRNLGLLFGSDGELHQSNILERRTYSNDYKSEIDARCNRKAADARDREAYKNYIGDIYFGASAQEARKRAERMIEELRQRDPELYEQLSRKAKEMYGER